MFANPVGYAFTQSGTAGLERYYDDDLAGKRNEFASLLDQVLGEKKEGKDLHTGPRSGGDEARAPGAAVEGGARRLRVRRGARAEHRPGARDGVDARASTRTRVPDETRRGVNPGNKRDNIATMRLTPPGSTFKVVTAAAAIDSGKYTPDSMISGKNGKKISGVPLSNDAGEDFGVISLTLALTHSVNTVFGEVGREARRRHHVQVHAPLRVRVQAAGRPALRRVGGVRRLPPQEAAARGRRGRRHRACRHRPVRRYRRDPRDPDPDGRSCGYGGQRRCAHEATDRRSTGAARRAARGQDLRPSRPRA